MLCLFHNQAPYHPQRLWANRQFDAELQEPLAVVMPPSTPVEPAPPDTLLHLQPIVEARLTEGVSSDTAKNGDAVHAVLTQPVYHPEHRLIFPKGAALTGVVLKAKSSRRFGRNGVLRFAFRSMQPIAGPEQTLQGQVTGAEAADTANVTVDEEGGVHANPDKDRFLGPLFLAVLAAGGHDDDGGSAQQGLASNGLGNRGADWWIHCGQPQFRFRRRPVRAEQVGLPALSGTWQARCISAGHSGRSAALHAPMTESYREFFLSRTSK